MASYLITSPDGHILINTSIEESIENLSANIGALGYDIADVKILLSMQSHFDPTADLARIKEETGAKMYATAPDVRVTEDAGFSDPHFGGLGTFRPIKVDKIVSDGEVIELGDIVLMGPYRSAAPNRRHIRKSFRANPQHHQSIKAHGDACTCGQTVFQSR